MRAFVIPHHAHPSKLQLSTDAPEPSVASLKGDEVLVEVYSAAFNFFDILQAQGKYQNQPPLPFVLGAEFAGRISSKSPIPSECPFKPGDRVFGFGQGAFGERVVTSWKNVLPMPNTLSYDQAAGLFITWPTSYEALVGRAELKPGEWVLVTASAGGVGIAACQLAKALGAKVIAAAGSAAKMEVSKKHGGADHVVNYTQPNWQKQVLQLTGGRGVDVIYDPVGMIKDCLKCIAWKGRAVVVGFAAGKIEQLPLNLVLLKNVSVVGIHWGAYTKNEPARAVQVWKELLALMGSNRVRPVVFDKIYTLDTLVQGLDDLEKRRTWGKAVVRVQDAEEKENAKL